MIDHLCFTKRKGYTAPSVSATDLILDESLLNGSNIAPGSSPIDPYDDPIDDNDNWS